MEQAMNKESDPSHVLETAYEMYSSDIFRYVLVRTRDRNLALDIIQDVFVRTLEYLQKGNVIDSIRPFLYKTATNIIIDNSRKRKASSLDSLVEEGFDPETLQKGGIEANAELSNTFKLFDKLDDSHKEILQLRHIDDLDISEIARILNISENSASVRIHRATKGLQKLLNKQT